MCWTRDPVCLSHEASCRVGGKHRHKQVPHVKKQSQARETIKWFGVLVDRRRDCDEMPRNARGGRELRPAPPLNGVIINGSLRRRPFRLAFPLIPLALSP